MTVENVFDQVCRDSPFYRRSGGGVTFSGGEPLLQEDFSVELFKRCREEGIHTALDTCGYAKWKDFREVLRYTDLVL